jgi:hypothetical protein
MAKQKLVYIRGDGSFLMLGDADYERFGADVALPKMLEEGWRIVELHPMPTKSDEHDVPFAYAVLEH